MKTARLECGLKMVNENERGERCPPEEMRGERGEKEI
jgi:hypothetical protein